MKKNLYGFVLQKYGSKTILDIFEQADIKLDAEHPYSCHYPVNLYKKYFKFSFIRNPWDKITSCWFDKVVANNHFRFSTKKLSEMQVFENFVNYVEQLGIDFCDVHIRSQSKLIDLNNIDSIGKFETFHKDLSKIIRIIDLGSVVIKYENITKNRERYNKYYNERLIQKVAKIYYRDINIFGYDFVK